MTMRNYLVTIHEDGHITVNEYTAPLTRKERDRVCGAAFQELASKLETYPTSLWAPTVKAAYLNGASHMMDILRKVL